MIDATTSPAQETSLSIPSSSSFPLLNDSGHTRSQDPNEDDNEDEVVDALPTAQPLDGTPDFLNWVQSRVVQQRNIMGQVVVQAERLDPTTSAIDQQQQGGQLRKVVGGLAILFCFDADDIPTCHPPTEIVGIINNDRPSG
jgi:hypothetical protein